MSKKCSLGMRFEDFSGRILSFKDPKVAKK